MSEKTVFIVNPHSATGKTGRRWADTEIMLKRVLGEFSTQITTQPGHATQLCRQALAEGAERIVAVGGDGTNHEVLNGFWDPAAGTINQNACLSCLPSGTGSDFARSLGSPTRIKALAERLQSGTERQIDVGRAEFVDHQGQAAERLFLNVASLGLSAEVVQAVNRKKRGGSLAYALATMSSVIGQKRSNLELLVDDKPSVRSDVNLVAIANGAYFGGGMNIAPNAKIDDRGFDLIQVWGWKPLTFILNSPKVYSGAHLDLPGVDEQRGLSRIQVRTQSPETHVLIELDGENLGRLPATFHLLPQALRIWS